MASKHGWKIGLIPWDFDSAEHVDRLVNQRLACGWRADEVPGYVEDARKGPCTFFWAVLSDQLPSREALIEKHIERYPKEASPLTDTATEVCQTSRQPSLKQFIPVGHVCLRIQEPEVNKRLGLPPSGVVWTQRLYLSYALQQGGLGAAIMAKAEQLAAREPFDASVMALDTVTKEVHTSEELMKACYDDRGLPRPVATNQEWYERQGYEVFTSIRDSYDWKFELETVRLHIVYLKKSLR